MKKEYITYIGVVVLVFMLGSFLYKKFNTQITSLLKNVKSEDSKMNYVT